MQLEPDSNGPCLGCSMTHTMSSNSADTAAACPGRGGLWLATFLLAVAGLAVSWAILMDYSGQVGLMDSPWLCGKVQPGDYGCAGVFASRYGKILGVPTPILGVFYFLGIGLWLVVFGRRAFNPLLLVVLAAGFATSLVLLYVLLFVLPGRCRWCLIVHGINVALVAGAGLGCRRFWRRAFQEGMGAYWAQAVIVALVVLALAGWAGTLAALRRGQRLEAQYLALRLNPQLLLWQFRSQTPRDIPLADRDHVLGPVDAAVQIVVYKDFQCEHCAAAWKMLFDLYRRRFAADGKVALIVRHWPWSRRCNSDGEIPGDPHPYACEAAWAIEAVAALAGEDAFWKYHQLLVENHDQLDRSPYAALAQPLGIDQEKFIQAWRSRAVQEKVDADVHSGGSLGVQAIPAVFINGRNFSDGWRIPELLENVINEEITGASAHTQPAQG